MSNTIGLDLQSFSQSLADLISRTASGVVAVRAAPYQTVSGVSLPGDLLAVTSHTLRRDSRVPVQAADGLEGYATILGRDKSLDLAILKVEGLPLAQLSPCDPASLKAGTLAAVVGMTSDVGASASLGIVGAVGPARRTWRGGSLDAFLRLDVNLYPSQSGAAVVNAEGQLIGMATPALSRHAAVAIPTATLVRVARELAEQGHIRQGYLGVGMQSVVIQESIAAKLANPVKAGLIFLSVEPDSPAEKAGLQIGDILLSLNGQPITQGEELQTALRGDIVGKSVPAAILRGGQLETVTVTVAERPRRA